jgi:hypothetical protein
VLDVAHSMNDRLGSWLLTAGAGAVLVGSFAPWVSALDRVDLLETSATSWDLRDIVLDLGFGEGSLFEIAVGIYIAVPILLVAGVAAAWWRYEVVGASLATGGALYGGVVALAVLLAPDIELYSIEWGVPLTLLGAILVLAGAATTVVVILRSRGSSSPTDS